LIPFRHPPARYCAAWRRSDTMPESWTAAEVARSVADTLERGGLPYAVGGAIALGFYAVPRATVDVDVNIFVSPEADLAPALAVLTDAGFVADDAASLRAHACSGGQFRGSVHGLRVDVFVPAIPYYAEIAARKRQVSLLGRPLWILGPEDLVVLKLMFFRRKDLADVEAIFRDQGVSLDRHFVRQKLVELVGESDERLAALDAIEHDVDAPA
jgi:hypothetical protein